jgi:hypothetical protein
MQYTEVIAIIKNKLTNLMNGKAHAFNAGDLPLVLDLEAQIIETQETLNKLTSVEQ